MPSPSTIAAIPDTDADYWLTALPRAELNLGHCVRRSEAHLSPSEQRGRFLSAAEAHAETAYHPVIAGARDAARWLCIGSLVLGALAVLLAGVVDGHLFLLPSATIWPMGVASLICAVASLATGVAGLRGVA